jgi:hypothetical protein
MDDPEDLRPSSRLGQGEAMGNPEHLRPFPASPLHTPGFKTNPPPPTGNIRALRVDPRPIGVVVSHLWAWAGLIPDYLIT